MQSIKRAKSKVRYAEKSALSLNFIKSKKQKCLQYTILSTPYFVRISHVVFLWE